ncbi:MAG: ABC transporter ATP-binding protein [Lachnospiraceae bacterium]|nr:ABC transporter ATP-binding protein [Lachnospiraceae bacterium]
MIHVKNLVKRYGKLVALDHFSLDVQDGEIFGLLGPNGSGKTTAINCILSLLTYDKGEISLFGEPMSPTNYKSKKKIGVVPQNVAVFNELTVQENIDYFCGLYVPEKAARKPLVEEAIEFAGLADFRRFLPKKLSGGLLRRLNIACGIAHKPELIFLDEPTVAVDPQSRNSILEGIRALNASGATIIYTSHYMEEVEQLCSRIMIMDKGRAIATGTREELTALIHTGEKLTVETPALPPAILEQIRNLPNVLRADHGDGHLKADCKGDGHPIIDVLDLLRQNNVSFGQVYSEPPTLNDVFLEITGKQLRD